MNSLGSWDVNGQYMVKYGLERGSVELTGLCTSGLNAFKQCPMLLLYTVLFFTAIPEVGLIIFLIFRAEQAEAQRVKYSAPRHTGTSMRYRMRL